jgi:uncharacterized membrane protein YvbJ
MFCSSCGNQLNAGLNYCNRCGSAIARNDSDARSSGNFSESLAYVGGGGFVCFIFVLLILVKNQVPPDTVTKIAFIYLATLFGICYLILRHVKTSLEKPALEQRDVQEFIPAVQLPPKTTNQLNEYQQPATTVTEETTRNFEKIPLQKS